jgi:hypothetical protein
MKRKLIMSSLFGKVNNLTFKKRFFQESSKLMKYKRFYNLNLISNHNFYNNFYFFLKNLEKNLIMFYLLKNNVSKHNIVPNFLFNKQIFFDFKNFIKFSRKNKIKFLYVNNTNLKNFDLYGNNFLLISNNIDLKEINNLKNEFNIDIFYKNNFNFFLKNDFFIISYFLNFNLFINNVIEFYKIIILLNLIKLI